MAVDQFLIETKCVNQTPNIPTVTRVRAIRSHQPSQQSNIELSFQFGDEIIVRNDNIRIPGWWQGELVRSGRVGVFPYQYTSVTEIEGELPDFINTKLVPFPTEEIVFCEKIQSPNSKEVKKNIRKYYKPNKAVQVCMGDFPLDKTDNEITEAVSMVIDAMHEGKIVILMNSSLINGSFNDLLNR